MSERLIARMLAPVARAVDSMIARGTVALSNSATKMQTLQIELLSGEAKDDIEHIEPYGFTSRPKSGAEHVTLFVGGDRSHGLTIMVGDRRYRMVGLAEGEVALHDDLGQHVHLTRSGIVIDGAGNPINIQNTPHVIADTLKFTFTNDVEILGKLDVTEDITGQAKMTAATVFSVGDVTAFSTSGSPLSMGNMKITYNGHTHVENALPGSTNVPTQQI